MRCRTIYVTLASVSMAISLTACAGNGGATGPADLVPIPEIISFDPPSLNFCNTENNEILLVTVRNQGGGDASSSTTTVEFSPGGPVDLPTNALSGDGGIDNLSFDIPAECFTADCDFTITVDSGDDVSESIETNNSASSGCIG